MSEVLRHAKYRRRTTIVEPCFGELKERHGLKRFRASVDCKLFAPNLPRHCIAFNLKKVVGHTAVLMICIQPQEGRGSHGCADDLHSDSSPLRPPARSISNPCHNAEAA